MRCFSLHSDHFCHLLSLHISVFIHLYGDFVKNKQSSFFSNLLFLWKISLRKKENPSLLQKFKDNVYFSCLACLTSWEAHFHIATLQIVGFWLRSTWWKFKIGKMKWIFHTVFLYISLNDELIRPINCAVSCWFNTSWHNHVLRRRILTSLSQKYQLINWFVTIQIQSVTDWTWYRKKTHKSQFYCILGVFSGIDFPEI